MFFVARYIGGDSGDALLAESLNTLGQQRDAVEDSRSHHRLEVVDLQLPILRGLSDCDIIADDGEAQLNHGHRQNRVHLAGHDRRTGLGLGQLHFADTTNGARRQHCQVGGNFRQRRRAGTQLTRHPGEHIHVLHGIERVGRCLVLDAGDADQMRIHRCPIVGWRTETCANGSAAER
ncbi:hypothetical protein FQZ97_580880 [compost metagenome]